MLLSRFLLKYTSKTCPFLNWWVFIKYSFKENFFILRGSRMGLSFCGLEWLQSHIDLNSARHLAIYRVSVPRNTNNSLVTINNKQTHFTQNVLEMKVIFWFRLIFINFFLTDIIKKLKQNQAIQIWCTKINDHQFIYDIYLGCLRMTYSKGDYLSFENCLHTWIMWLQPLHHIWSQTTLKYCSSLKGPPMVNNYKHSLLKNKFENVEIGLINLLDHASFEVILRWMVWMSNHSLWVTAPGFSLR